MNRLGPAVIFAIFVIVDFVLGYIKWHSIGSGLVAIVCGLPLNTLLFLGFRAWWNRNDEVR